MNILLAMDMSPASEAALEQVAGRPWPAGSSFEVVSVVEPSHLWTTSEIARETALCAEETVRKAVERLRAANLSASGSALAGDPKTVILDRARAAAADFIVLGSHGGSAAARFLLGNVAGTVLRHAPCPVEIARSSVHREGGSSLKLLLATDGSGSSEGAARSVAERPWPAGSEVRVLSVVELILPATRALFEPPFIDTEYLETARGAAMKRSLDAIARAREILTGDALSVSESISVLPDTPRSLILAEAADWGADMIVLGSHGRHGVDRFLLGSVSEAIAMHAPCSVEVIRSKG